MKKGSVNVYVIVFAVVVFIMLLSVGSLVCMNIETRADFFRENSYVSKFGMNEPSYSEIIVSEEQFAVENPEGYEAGIVMNASLTKADWQRRQNAGLTNSNIKAVMKRSEKKYAYSILSDELKSVYAEIYLIISGRLEHVPICSIDETDIKYVSECVYLDSPELFYYDGYSFSKTILKDKIIKIEYNPFYNMSYDETMDMDRRIDEYVTNCLAGISTDMDDYQKVKYLYEYLIMNTEYDEAAEYNQTICSVVTTGRTLCLGYTRAMQYLLQELGIQSFVVMGSNKAGVSHAWNVVQLGSAFYHIDVTWGDSSYPEYAYESSDINFYYFCVTTEEILRTHIIDSVVPIPRCVLQNDNFYIREGCYLTEKDKQKLAWIFSESDTGHSFVTLKCSDANVYEKVGSHLIDEYGIRDYINGNYGDIQYIENDVLYIYTFFL